ncbi:MAG: hypothetical protein JWO11_3371, partial [Nocardioides sp.]|nr:hypothetical protein [Nocardioides sp.]
MSMPRRLTGPILAMLVVLRRMLPQQTPRGRGRRRLLGLVTVLAVVASGFALTAAPVSAAAVPAPSIQSDQADYPPGALVRLTGANWQPGEPVHIYVNDDEGRTWDHNADVVADDVGAVTDSFNLPDWFVATYQVTATGALSGVATSSFTDGNFKLKVGPSDTIAPMTATTFNSTNCTGTGTATGKTTGDQVGVSGTQSLRLDAPATGTPGTRTFVGWTLESGSFTEITGTAGRSICIVGFAAGSRDVTANYTVPTATAVISGSNPSSYGNAVTFTASVTSSSTNPSAGTVTFSDGAIALCNAVALVGNQATCSTPALVAGTLNVGSHSVTATYNPSGNYLASTSTALTQQVSKRTLTGAFTADNKIYDGNTTATIATRSLAGGTVPGDAVGLGGGTATFNSRLTGTGKVVTGTGFSLTGTDAAAKYLLASSTLTTTAAITLQGVTVSLTAGNKTYDGDTAASITGRSLSGAVTGDDVSVSGGTATFGGKDAGAGKTVTASGFTLGGADAGNYSIVGVNSTTADITAKSLTGSFAAANKVYDGNTDATVTDRSLTGVVAGDAVSLSGGTASFGTRDVGTNKTVTLSGASLAGADAGNYTLSSVDTTTADITSPGLTVSFTAANKAYDGNIDATIASRSLEGVAAGDTVTISGGAAIFGGKDVGTGKTVTGSGFTLGGADAGNYSIVGVNSTTADITAKSLTGSFTAANKVYDGNTDATVNDRSLTGVVGDDAVSLSGGTASFGTSDVDTNKTVTLSGASLAGADAGNYTLS